MVWYVALVAISNLALGYGLAVYLRTMRECALDEPAIDVDDADLDVSLQQELSESFDERDAIAIKPPAPDIAAPLEPPHSDDVDPATGLMTRDQIEQRLSDLTLAHADLQPMTIALLEIDQSAHGVALIDDRLLRGVAGTVCELLTEAQTAGRYADQQFLLLLPHDDLQDASQRAEQVRQRVAATSYLADGEGFPATLTCAVTQVAASQSVSDLLEFLEETLDEARRYGGNRTFMHDGSSPVPVVPPELNLTPQTCAI
jgi:GGDEF domain-containing protein